MIIPIFIDEEMEAESDWVTWLSQVGLSRKQIPELLCTHQLLHSSGSALEINTHGTKGMGTGDGRRSWAVRHSPMVSAKPWKALEVKWPFRGVPNWVRMARSLYSLSINYWIWDPSKGWTLGEVPLQLRQIPKGLTDGSSLLPTIPAARATSPSLTQKLGGTSPCPEC